MSMQKTTLKGLSTVLHANELWMMKVVLNKIVL